MKFLDQMHGCKRQFQCSNCGFDHSPANNFIKSQWQNRTHSKWYLIYRWILGLYFLAVVLTSMTHREEGTFWHFFIYLTNWGIMLCAITTLFAAVNVSIWYCHPQYVDNAHDIVDMPRSFKVYWWFNNITLVLSICITIIYWAVLYNPEQHNLSAVNVMTHATNSILMFLDMMIVSHPYRLLHVVQPILFGIVYAIFSVIYYFAGGLDVKGNPYIYFILDWSKPGSAFLTILMVLALCFVVHTILMLVYYLRTVIYIRYFYQPDLLPTSQSHASTTSSLEHSASNNKISMVFGHENKVFDITSEGKEGK